MVSSSFPSRSGVLNFPNSGRVNLYDPDSEKARDESLHAAKFAAEEIFAEGKWRSATALVVGEVQAKKAIGIREKG